MVAPRYIPLEADSGSVVYESPDHVPSSWTTSKPGSFTGSQPTGLALGYQGPDQGFAMKIARLVSCEVNLQEGESLEDAICVAVAISLRRASYYGRAPVVHDLRIAFDIWGWMLVDPPVELVTARKKYFSGVANSAHKYQSIRLLVDLVPISTILMTPEKVTMAMPGSWRALTGAN